MVRKVYAYPGIASGDILVKVGLKAHVRVSFTNGYIDKKMSRPATYSTGDPVMQQIIENSELFGRRIFLQNTYSSESAPAKAAATVVDESNPVAESIDSTVTTASEYPEVTSWEEAVKILKAIPGVKVANLRTPASAKKVAAANGVYFPNYNFD